MEIWVLEWLWGLIYVNGQFTAVAGSLIVVVILAAITKYILLPIKKSLVITDEDTHPNLVTSVVEVKITVDEVLDNQKKMSTEAALHNKIVVDVEKDVAEIKSALNKTEAMVSIMSITTSRGLK